MNNWCLRLLTAAMVAFSLLACDSKTEQSSLRSQSSLAPSAQTMDLNKIMAENSGDPVASAEQLALAGEQLVTPLSFMYADSVFDQSLSFDPDNKRAQFFKAFIAPSVALKGLLAKVRPYLENEGGKGLQDYNDLINYKLPESGLKNFLLDGRPTIENEKDIQDFLASFRDAQGQLRMFLKNNKDLRLTLNMNIWDAQKKSLKAAAKNCWVRNDLEGVYSISDCKYTKAFQLKVEKADVEVLQHIAAGMQIYTTLLTAYDATGTISLAKNSQGQQFTHQEIVNYLEGFEDFGTLREDNALQLIPKLGSDLLAGVKWAHRLQSKLCPAGLSSPQNRPGFLVSSGICIRSGSRPIEDVFKTIELALSGQAMEIMTFDRYGNEVRADVVVAAPFLSPIADLKDTFPTTFNSCGGAKDLKDDTFLGIFPNSDAIEVLTGVSYLDKECY